MMVEITATYEFEFLNPQIDGYAVQGMDLHGIAKLASSDYETEPHEFYVTEIELAGGLTLRPKMVPNGHVDHREWLFKAITAILQSDRTAHGQAAQHAFDEEVEGRTQPDPDEWYDEMRDRRFQEAAE